MSIAIALAPVVLELFTSQGCSSCPPADRLVSTWGAERFARGEVLPLSFDVDYWNYLGWKDAFSRGAWSARQADYAASLGVRTYTPQMVASGRAAFLGSDRDAAEAAVARLASRTGLGRAAVEVVAGPASRLHLRVSATHPGGGKPRAWLALFENGLVTEVTSGENSGEKLRNDFVVRRLVDLGPLPLSRSVDQAWDPAWRRDHMGAAVFVQDDDTRAIDEAGWAYPLAQAGR